MARIAAGQKEVVRERLLSTAASHFARAGLAGASVDAISLDAGFAKGTLYNYFASKEDLFAAVIREAAARAAHDTGPAHASTRERLVALARSDVEVLERDEAFVQVLVREAMSFCSETYPLILESLTPYVARITEVLEAGVAAGEIRDDRPVPQLALLFVGMISLMYVQHWGSGGAWPALAEIPELVVETFLDGARR